MCFWHDGLVPAVLIMFTIPSALVSNLSLIIEYCKPVLFDAYFYVSAEFILSQKVFICLNRNSIHIFRYG